MPFDGLFRAIPCTMIILSLVETARILHLSAYLPAKQVFCVTHLPQIAAAADSHLLIAKEIRQGRTYTSVTKLDQPGRVEELSRIIGGSQITDITRKSAEEMILQERS